MGFWGVFGGFLGVFKRVFFRYILQHNLQTTYNLFLWPSQNHTLHLHIMFLTIFLFLLGSGRGDGVLRQMASNDSPQHSFQILPTPSRGVCLFTFFFFLFRYF